MNRLLWRIGVPVGAAIAWEAAAALSLISRSFAPPPSVLFVTTLRMIGSGELAAGVAATLARTAAGSLAGAAAGFVIGLFIGGIPAARSAIEPMLSALNATPKLVLLPLGLILFGLGETSKIVLIAAAVLTIVAIHTADALRHVHPAWVEMATNYGADRPALVRHVYVPACLPQVFTGLRIGVGNALVIAVSCELVNPATGLGSIVWLSWQTFSIDRLYVAILTTAALGAGLHETLRRVERRLVPWAPHER